MKFLTTVFVSFLVGVITTINSLFLFWLIFFFHSSDNFPFVIQPSLPFRGTMGLLPLQESGIYNRALFPRSLIGLRPLLRRGDKIFDRLRRYLVRHARSVRLFGGSASPHSLIP